MSDSLPTETEVRETVRALANRIHDPCALGAGMQIGMADMGLIRDLALQPDSGGWRVAVTLRFTGPECMNYFYFKHNLQRELRTVPHIAEVDITFSAAFDWSEEEMSVAAREQLRARTAHLRTLLPLPVLPGRRAPQDGSSSH